jgi:hypothetical protein
VLVLPETIGGTVLAGGQGSNIPRAAPVTSTVVVVLVVVVVVILYTGLGVDTLYGEELMK